MINELQLLDEVVLDVGEIVEIDCEKYKLKGNLVIAPQSTKPVVLIGHGAAKDDDPIKYLVRLQEFLAKNGYSSLSIHNRGVGSGELLSEGPYESTILDRVSDFQSAAAYLLNLGISTELILIACSLNGETAALTAPRIGNKLKAIALLEPAAYSPGVENIKLNIPEFTFALRRPDLAINKKIELQMQSPTFSALQKFPGSLFVAYGEKDKKVDKPIRDRYKDIIYKKGNVGEFLEIPDAGHILTAYAPDALYEKLMLFLDKTIATS